MGSCLSPVLSNIFMEFFESELLPNVLDVNSCVWLRYVDDIFCILPDTTNLDELLQKLNGLHNNIKFKIEIENNNVLPFLDVTVIRNINNNLSFKIYRKPTCSNSYIHAFSSHSDNIKTGSVSNIFLRAYKFLFLY